MPSSVLGRSSFALVALAVLICVPVAHGASHRASSRAVKSARSAKSQPKAKARPANTCGSCSSVASASKRPAKRLTKRVRATATPCHPKGYVDPHISKNLNSAIRSMKRAGITPKITSTWRSSQVQASLHSCTSSTRCRRANPGLYRALPAGRSLHEAAFAVDIAGVATGPRGAKRLTPRGRKIVLIMKRNGFNWPYGLSDPVHFEADPRKHGYRTVRQAIVRSQTTCQAKLASASRPGRRTSRSKRTTPRETAHASPKATTPRQKGHQG